MKRLCLVITTLLLMCAGSPAAGENLLLNPTFDFHSFTNHRDASRESWKSGYVAFWNAGAHGDVTVMRESHVDVKVRPPFATRNLVTIASGKTISQFLTLGEAGLAHGEQVSLHVFGRQSKPRALRARIRMLKTDSQDGTWSPKQFRQADARRFHRHGRGEFVTARLHESSSPKVGPVELRIEGAKIEGHFTEGRASRGKDVNTLGLQVEFENTSGEQVWVYWPSLVSGAKPVARAAEARRRYPWYRHIPKTIQKLWKGETIHILLLGSSIDRASANPPPYFYDEDPKSKTFKQPICKTRTFEPALAGRPDLAGYVAQWQHYFSYGGRLRLELMRKFNLPVSKICLNIMACDGSSVGEAHSGLRDYCELRIPPDAGGNGHPSGKTWRELYPGLFNRPQGPGPDLVIFGSGANEKTDTPDEVAVFEGMVRWIQRNHPEAEFLFCMWQNHGRYTPNTGDLRALSLRYQIPFLDFDRYYDDVLRWCNYWTLTPDGGHPQAGGHYLWFKNIERAFECWDPSVPGIAQLRLPARLHANTYGWEGEMVTFGPGSKRIKGAKFIFEDTAVNCWGDATKGRPEAYVDGVKLPARRGMKKRSLRNSFFRHGRCRLGDRHVLEVAGVGAKLHYVDAKVCPNRRYFGVDGPRWRIAGLKAAKFDSQWGAPYGAKQVVLAPGRAATLEAVFTDLSVAYVDAPKGGTVRVLVDRQLRIETPANVPFVDVEKRKHFMENRKGTGRLPWGLHTVRVEAVGGPVALLGAFTYDSRPSRSNERRIVGRAAPGETLAFSPAFKARPLVICHGLLAATTDKATRRSVTFSGTAPGAFEIIGE